MKMTIIILQWRIDYASFLFFRTDRQRWIIDSFFNRRFSSSSNKTGCHLDHRIVVQWRWRTNTATPLDTRRWRNGRQRSPDDCPQPSRSSWWYGRSSLMLIKRRHCICNCQLIDQVFHFKKNNYWRHIYMAAAAAVADGGVVVWLCYCPNVVRANWNV